MTIAIRAEPRDEEGLLAKIRQQRETSADLEQQHEHTKKKEALERALRTERRKYWKEILDKSSLKHIASDGELELIADAIGDNKLDPLEALKILSDMQRAELDDFLRAIREFVAMDGIEDFQLKQRAMPWLEARAKKIGMVLPAPDNAPLAVEAKKSEQTDAHSQNTEGA
jgi:hypothetical protein